MLKSVSLSELHSWIVEARELMYDEKHETMLAPEDLIVAEDDPTKPKEVEAAQQITTILMQTLKQLNDLDNEFHDRFDCRTEQLTDTSTDNHDLDSTTVFNDAGDGVTVNPWELVENAIENAPLLSPEHEIAIDLLKLCHTYVSRRIDDRTMPA